MKEISKKVFIVHGFYGEPNGGWRPWLMGKLAREDIWAVSLAMPTPDYPKKEEWVAEINRAVGEPNSDTFLVGHSLGVPAVLKYLESLPENKQVGGVVLVAGPFETVKKDDKESKLRRIDNFFEPDFNFEYIKSRCKKFSIVHAKDDPNVPINHAEKLASALDAELVILENGGHLNGSSGCYELPEALTALQKMF